MMVYGSTIPERLLVGDDYLQSARTHTKTVPHVVYRLYTDKRMSACRVLFHAVPFKIIHTA